MLFVNCASGVKALLASVMALAVVTTSAHAATVGATVGADPLEDRPFNVTLTGDTPSSGVYGLRRAAPGPACGPSWKKDTGDPTFFGDAIGTIKALTVGDPGTYKLCLFQQFDAFSEVATAVGEVPITVRPNIAAIGVLAPVTALEGSAVSLRIVGATEVPRQVFARTKPAGSGPCAATALLENAAISIAFKLPANGAFDLPITTDPIAFQGRGRYVVCAWMQEDLSDDVAEAVGSAFVTMGPPLPVLSRLSIAPAVVRPSGAIVRFSLNTPATVRFRVQERRLGRRVGANCVRPTRALRRNARCTRFVSVAGGFSRGGKSGANAFRYSARTSGRRLLAGRYRLLATPSNATGRGTTLRRSFRIPRRR